MSALLFAVFVPVSFASDLVILGNSYVLQHSLDAAIRETLRAGVGDEGETTRLAAGGYTFSAHLDEVSRPGNAWSDALATDQTWDWAILQEQSQIPGFPQDDATWRESEAAGRALNAAVAAAGGQTVLLMTWGRRDGDADNPTLYPDYATMQDRLAAGYLAYRDAWSTAERPVWVAPVGLAFAEVYRSGVDFELLYEADGSHPSEAGTWLAACVVYATITGQDPTLLPGPASLDAALAGRLAEAARVTVLEGDLSYPWTDDGAGDSGVPDTGVPDSGEPDTGVPDSGVPGDSAGSNVDKADAGGCGCGTGSGAGVVGLFGALMLVGRRRG